MKLRKAEIIAEKIKAELAPHCERIEITGDIRGKKQEVESIDIVAIPNTRTFGLLHDGISSVVEKWEKIEDSLEYNFTQRLLPSGIKLHLHFAKPDNWGLISVLSTGNREYIYRCIATGWSIYGIEFDGNNLYKDGKKIALYEEDDMFKIIQKPFVEPELRYL
jgi:DNA polymerase/3'-5' exonuclease PolX